MAERKDSSRPISGEFCPPPRGPIEGWLDHLTAFGSPLVELDGRQLPRVRDPVRQEWATRAAAAGLEFEKGASTTALAQAVLTEETVKALEGVAPRRPGSNLRLCLEAAYMHRIQNVEPKEIATYLGIIPQGDRRNLRRIIANGEKLWEALGAWPWALYKNGRLGQNWRADPIVAHELEDWYRNSLAERADRLRRESQRVRRAQNRLPPRSPR